MLGKIPKYTQANTVIQGKTSKDDTNKWGRGTFLNIYISNKNLLGKKICNSNNISRKK